MSSYSIINAALDSGQKCPVSGLIIDIVQFDAESYGYRLYRDNFEEFSDPDKQKAFEWLSERAQFAAKLAGVEVGIDMDANSQGESNG